MIENYNKPPVAESKVSYEDSTSYSNVDHDIEGKPMFDTLRRTATPHTTDMVDTEAPAPPSSHAMREAEGQYHLYKEGDPRPVRQQVRETTTVLLPDVHHPRTTAPHIIAMTNIEAPPPPVSHTLRVGHRARIKINQFPGFAKIQRAYPMVLEGRLSERDWNDEFCDPVDKVLTEHYREMFPDGPNCFELCLRFRFLVIGLFMTSSICMLFEDEPLILYTTLTVFGLFIILMAYRLTTRDANVYTGQSESTEKLSQICKNVTMKCNGVITLYPKRDIRHRQELCPTSYDYVYHIELEVMVSSADASKNTVFMKNKPSENVSRAAASRSSTLFVTEKATKPFFPPTSKSTAHSTGRSSFM